MIAAPDYDKASESLGQDRACHNLLYKTSRSHGTRRGQNIDRQLARGDPCANAIGMTLILVNEYSYGEKGLSVSIAGKWNVPPHDIRPQNRIPGSRW